MTPVVSAKGIVKRYGHVTAIDPKDYTMSDAVAFMTGAKEPPAQDAA